MTYGKLLIGITALVVGLYGLASLIRYPTIDIKYRLTIEAMTPEGPVQGSGIIQVSFGSYFSLAGRGGVSTVTGEAIPVDLGEGKILFVTLTNNVSGRPARPRTLTGAQDSIWLPVSVFNFKWRYGQELELARQVAAARQLGPRGFSLYALPTLVTFGNINDPLSVVVVRPERLSATFGKGYELANATMELTDDPMTEQILTVLPWLPRLQQQDMSTLDGVKHDTFGVAGAPVPVTSQLSYTSFKMPNR